MKATAIIPSRYGSKRLEGKPLIPIAGKPMIQRVYELAMTAKSIHRVIVATDDHRILEAVKAFGGQAMMTPDTLPSGTDRVAYTADELAIKPDEVVVNIQGDQPIFTPSCIDEMLAPFETIPGLDMATLACKITNPREINDPKDVKVVMDHQGFALYFSRARIPFPRDDDEQSVDFYKHLGFYAYTRRFLDLFANLPAGMLENIEKLEQLRVLEHGYRIKVAVTKHDSPEMDLIEDIERIEEAILQQQKKFRGNDA